MGQKDAEWDGRMWTQRPSVVREMVGFVLVGRQARDTLWTEGERLISSQDTA